MIYKCDRCSKRFKNPKVVLAAEYPGGKMWPYESCPFCDCKSFDEA